MSNTFHYATRHQREMNSNTSMPCFHQDFLVFSLLQKFSIIPEWHGSRTRRCASSLIVAEMCGNINTNESASMQGDSCLFSCNSCPLFGAHFPLPCSAAAILHKAKTKESYVKSLLCFLCFHGLCTIGLLYICMCYGCD